MGSMKMSCQESPVAIEEGWWVAVCTLHNNWLTFELFYITHEQHYCRPSIEMWLPTVPTADAVAPDCMPDLHPPVVMSFRPECSLFKNNMASMNDILMKLSTIASLSKHVLLTYTTYRPSLQNARKKAPWLCTIIRLYTGSYIHTIFASWRNICYLHLHFVHYCRMSSPVRTAMCLLFGS